MEIKKHLVRFNHISSSRDKDEKQIYLITTIEGHQIRYYSGHRIKPDNFIIDKKNSKYLVRRNTFNKANEPAVSINAKKHTLENASLIVFEQNFKGRDIEFSKEDYKRLLKIQLGEYK